MSDLGSPSSATQPAAAAAAGDDPDLGSPSSAAQQAAFVAHVFPGADEDCPFDDDGLEDDLAGDEDQGYQGMIGASSLGTLSLSGRREKVS